MTVPSDRIFHLHGHRVEASAINLCVRALADAASYAPSIEQAADLLTDPYFEPLCESLSRRKTAGAAEELGSRDLTLLLDGVARVVARCGEHWPDPGAVLPDEQSLRFLVGLANGCEVRGWRSVR